MNRRRTRVRTQESQPRNSTAVNDVAEPKAFVVWLEVPDEVVKVEVAGVDKLDAARRARWAVVRERALSPTIVRVVGCRPADEILSESTAAAS